MQLYSFAPLPVGVLSWNAAEPRVTVVTKLTLRYGRGGFAIDTTAQEPLNSPIPSLFGSAAELYHPGDFVPAKARCDVLLAGNAYAAMPLTAIGARLKVNTFEKRFFALAGQHATAIPLCAAYLRRKRRFDAEAVTVAARSATHPERARFARITEAAARETLPDGFDFAFFNAAPEDQQIDPVGPGARLSLEGLCPDGVPVEGTLPDEWPQISAIQADGRIANVPLTCDTVWIDTDRQLCALTLRGLFRPLPVSPRGRESASEANRTPIAFVVALTPWSAERAPPRLVDLARAQKGRVVTPEDTADELDPADLEEIEPESEGFTTTGITTTGTTTTSRGRAEVQELDASHLEDDPTFDRLPAPKPASLTRPPSDEPKPEPAPPPRALGLLGAMQLRHSRAVEMPALPTAHRRPATIPPSSGPRRPRTLPFPTSREALEASQAQTVSKPTAPATPAKVAPTFSSTGTLPPGASLSPTGTLPAPQALSATGARQSAPSFAPPFSAPNPPAEQAPKDGPKRSQTLQIDPWAAGRDPLPQRWRAQAGPPPPATPNPADEGPKRARTLDLLPGTPVASGAPFPIAPSAARTGPLDSESARARFMALTAARRAIVAPEPVERTVEPEDIAAPPPPAHVPFALESPQAPPPDDAPWAGTLPRRPTRQPHRPVKVIERVGLLPLDVDAAVQQAIWEGTSTLQEILARHGLDEVTWRDHLRRREEALRDDAEKGSADRAAAARAALDKARSLDAPHEPAIDLLEYAKIRSRIDDAGDEIAVVLASHNVPVDVWEREHRAYRKRIREEAPFAERFKAALEEARSAPEPAAEAPAAKKKVIAKKYGPGAQAATGGDSGSARPPGAKANVDEKKSGAARRRPA